MASAGGLNASDRHPSQADSGLSDSAVFGNMAFKAFHLSGTRFLVDAHDLAQFLRIEAFRKFSRPDQIAEHYG